MSFVPRSLRQLLGSNTQKVTEDKLSNLLELLESDELEFKQQLNDLNEEKRRDLGADIASFANHKGGIIIIGIAESGDGQPYRLASLSNDSLDGEGLRVQQIVATWVVPMVSGLQVIPIRGDEGGYLLISIPPSVRRPHAVVNADSLRYPIRSGSGKRYLSESEVADKYRNRFDEAAGQVCQLHDRHELLVGELDRSFNAWLTVALQPDMSGSVPYSREFASSLEKWIDRHLDTFLGLHGIQNRSLPLAVRGGFRSYRFTDNKPDPEFQFGILHRDGGGSVAHGWNTSDGDSSHTKIIPEDLVSALINSLFLLASWATEHASVDGDAAVVAQFHPPPSGSMLWRNNPPFTGAIPGSSPLSGSTSIANLTVNLTAIVEDGRDLLLAARGLSEDLLSEFEYIGPTQIDLDGSLRIKYFSSDRQGKIREWAAGHNVVVTEETLKS